MKDDNELTRRTAVGLAAGAALAVATGERWVFAAAATATWSRPPATPPPGVRCSSTSAKPRGSRAWSTR